MIKKKHIIIGLTGGIASGKSTVLKEFKHLGARVVDADKISREIIRPRLPAWKKIVRKFGRAILRKNNQLDRKKLGRIVFSNVSKRKILERITHPVIISEIKKQVKKFVKESKKAIIMIDTPLLFEAKLEKMTDKVIVVWCTKKCQIERLLKKTSLNRPEIEKRIKAQMPIDIKKKKADFLINNCYNITKLKTQTKQLWDKISRQAMKNRSGK